MKHRLRDFLVGLTSIVALCGLAALLLLFGELRSLWQSRYLLVVIANTSAGLRPGSQVTVNGVVAGAVEQISLDAEGGPAPVRILAMIDTHVTVPLEARPEVGVALLGGGQKLDLVLPERWNPEQVASRTEASVLTGRFEGLGALITRLSGFVEQASGTLQTVEAAVRKAEETFATAKSTIEHADNWINDEQMRQDLRAAVFSTRKAVEAASRLAERLEGDTPRLLASLTEASDKLGRTLESVDAAVRDASKGGGTVGLLMSNPDLYNSLVDASRRLSSVLKDAQLLLQKVKQEGLDVKF